MRLIFEQIMTGGDRNMGYLLADRQEKKGVVIDPSYSPERFLERAKAQDVQVTTLLNTHGHADHTNGNDLIVSMTQANVLPFDFKDGEITIGKYRLQWFFTPGHSEDHRVFYLPDYQLLISGDHLFVGKIGGTKTKEDAKQQYESFQRLFKEVPIEATVWPGHNYGCRPSSTLFIEKITNPFLMAKDFEEFYSVKEKWSGLKQQLGLL